MDPNYVINTNYKRKLFMPSLPKRSTFIGKKKSSSPQGVLKLRPLAQMTSVVEEILKISHRKDEPPSPVLERPKRIKHVPYSSTLPIKSINIAIGESPKNLQQQEKQSLLFPAVYKKPSENPDVETRSIGVSVDFPSDSLGYNTMHQGKLSDPEVLNSFLYS